MFENLFTLRGINYRGFEFSLIPLSEGTLEESIQPYLYHHCNDPKLRKMGSAQSQNRNQGSQHFRDRKTLLCERT